MEIDIYKLPIPDWNLHCRRCGYVLNGLPEHRCPECGVVLEMEHLVHSWTRLREPSYTGTELPFPDFGLQCPACDSPLAGATSRCCPACGRAFDPASWLPARDEFLIEPSGQGELKHHFTELLLGEAYIPYIRRERKTAATIYGIDPNSRVCYEVPRDFYFDWLALVQRERTKGAPGPEWQCGHCGESNPGSFEVCWQCRRGRF